MKKNTIFRRTFLRQSLVGLVSTLFATRLSATAKIDSAALPSFLLDSDPFLGQIDICAYDYAPRGWALCNGQLLPIASNQGLFSLLGTTFGGNGTTDFALPDFRGRMPIHVGNSRVLGQTGGSRTTTLSAAQIPALSLPTRKVLIRDATGTQALGVVDGGVNGGNSTIISRTGTGALHNNLPPYQALNFIIAVEGIFPSRG